MIPSPADSGWVLSAHMTNNLPAPLATIEMSVCKCDKSKCVWGNCSCYCNIIKCSDMCGCLGCALFSKFLGHNPPLVELDELN